MIGFVRERIEITRWRGLIAAGLGALALLGLGLGFRPLLLGVPLALLVLLAGSVLPPLRGIVPRRAPRPLRRTLAWRWSRLVQAHPWTGLLVGVALLLALAAPIPSLHLNFPDESNNPEETTTRRAYDLLAEGFGPGFNGPLIVTAQPTVPEDRAALDTLLEALGNADGVALASGPLPSDLSDPANALAYLIQVFPETAPQDEATSDLVRSLRGEVVPSAVAGSTLDVNVTGRVASSIDFTTYLSGRTPLFVGAVLALSFVLLMIVFRSIVVPIKAVIMNLLSISAAFGVVVAIFQWGWLGSLIGIAGGPIGPFVPMMLFAIVFGLSMDYEVFLLSRVREAYFRTGKAIDSVADGLASTAQLIHRRRRDHGRRLRQLRVRGLPHAEDVRPRPRGRGGARRDGCANAAGPGDDGAAGRAQLVAAGLARSRPAAADRRGVDAAGRRRTANRPASLPT